METAGRQTPARCLHFILLTEFFDEVRQKCTFQYWFFGHYHSNMVIEKRYAMLYEQIIRLK